MSGVDGVTSASTPVVDQSTLPASVRNGTAAQKKEYTAALGFEKVLVGQLTQSMMATTSVTGDDSSEDAATKAMKQNLPGILTDALMGAGGIGLAQQLDSSWSAAAGDVKTTSLSGGADAPADSTTAPGSTPDASGGATA